MFRGILALALIFCLLAGQLAACRHSHAGMSAQEQQEHDAHPHVHITAQASHSHHRGHHHPHKGSHHSHSHRHHAQNSTNADPVHCVVDSDHDADAIYLHSLTLTNQAQPKADQHLADNSVAFEAIYLFELTPLASSTRWHPPDKPLASSDIYLLLRNLRI